MLIDEHQFPFDAVYCYEQPFAGRQLWRIAARKIHEAATHARRRYYIEKIEALGVRLLHAHFGDEGYHNLGMAKQVQLPMVTTFYGYDVSMLPVSYPYWRKRFRRLFDQGSLFLAEGSYMAQSLVDLGCPPNKVRVQHLGVDVQQIQFAERTKDANDPVRFIMAASFREKKGIPFAIQAFASAVQEQPKMELRIVGGANSHEECALLKHCKALATGAGVTDKVHFLGPLPYRAYLEEIEGAHIFLAPSVKARNGDTEGGAPVALIEALARGLPAIASRHCDIPEVVLDRLSGILVTEKDVEGLSRAMLELAGSPDAWPVMGRAGRQHIEQEYNLHKQVERLEGIYDELV
ncbi:MAG: colanic acid biosynthesis glycosyltransferase WcaL [Candidatus Uhrbacteria bacterium]